MLGFRIELTDVAGRIPSAHTDQNGTPRGVLVSLPTELDTTLAREDMIDISDHRAGAHEAGLPFRTRTAEALWVLRNVLTAWVPDLGGPSAGTARDLAVWLLDHLHRIPVFEDAGSLVDEVTNAIHQARRAIDRPNDRRVFLGKCGHRGPGPVVCVAEVYGLPWETHAHCPQCSTEYQITKRQDQMRDQAEGYLGTATEIAGFLRGTGLTVTGSMIRKYAHNQWITPVTANPRGHPLYRIGDVRALHRELTENPPKPGRRKQSPTEPPGALASAISER